MQLKEREQVMRQVQLLQAGLQALALAAALLFAALPTPHL
jgi:hypothetical protein